MIKQSLVLLFAFVFGCLLISTLSFTDNTKGDNCKAHPQKKPNFIVILADDMGYGDTSSNGHPTIRTPTIDRMVAEGKRLTSHYTCPMCTPTRGSLLTGRLPIRTGLYNGMRNTNEIKFPLSPEGREFNCTEKELLLGTHPERLKELGFDISSFSAASNSTCQNTLGNECSPLAPVLYPTSTKGLPNEEITIAEALKEVGYTSAIIGKWHLGVGSQEDNFQTFLPLQQGFDRFWGMPYSNDMGCPPGIGYPCTPTAGPASKWVPVPLYLDNDIIEQPTNFSTYLPRQTAEAIRFIKESHKEKKPFFLYFATVMPHVPLFASPDFLGKSQRGLYGDVIQEFDNSIAEILAVVEELGIDCDTMSLVMSDNGPWLGMREHGGSAGLFSGGKGTTWEGGIRSPAVVRWPSMISPGTAMSGITAAWDIFTTLVSISGAEMPTDRDYDGIDMSPALFGDQQKIRDCQNMYSQEVLMATRCDGYKVHWFTKDGFGVPNKQDPPLVFDVDADPSEKYPLDVEKYQDIIDVAFAYKEGYEASFEPGASTFEFVNYNHQPCCCEATNCVCALGYVCPT